MAQQTPSSKVHLSIHVTKGSNPGRTPHPPSLHWLPCKAAQSSDADVAKHFYPTIVSIKDIQQREGATAAKAHRRTAARVRSERLQNLHGSWNFTVQVTLRVPQLSHCWERPFEDDSYKVRMLCINL